MSEEGEMTASLRRRSCSPAAPPLEDDDLLSEILLRLPPQPSSLPRASAVCKRWRHLVSDPRFRRRFRLRHRSNPPLLGFFAGGDVLSFRPTLEAPDCVPPERFSLQGDDGDGFLRPLGCRHGLVLILLLKRLQILVWDPVTGNQHRVDVPPGFATGDLDEALINGAVLPAAGDVQHFQVVLVVADGDDVQHIRGIACVYSSETGLWGSFISTPLPYHAHGISPLTIVYPDAAVLARDSLYWLLAGNFDGILEFDLGKQRLSVIRLPVDICGSWDGFRLILADGGVLGFLFMSDSDCCTTQLWKRIHDCDGVASWVLARTIQLDKLLSLKPEEKGGIEMVGFAQDNSVLLLRTVIGLFTIHLESLKFKKLSTTTIVSRYLPFESVYTAVTGTGGRRDASDVMHNK